MRTNPVIRKGHLVLSVVFATVISVSLVAAQEIVPVRDIVGGTSVFIFRTAARSVSKKFVSQARSRRTAQQKAETAQRVNRQFTTLAKVAPRRSRSQTVDPKDLPPPERIKIMAPDAASRLFAGVGEHYMDRNDFDRSIDFFRTALELQSTNERARSGLSEALGLKGNELLAKNAQQLAQKFFEEAIQINPRNAPALFGLAEILSDQGKEAEAVANYEKALQFDGDLTEIYVPLGVLYYQAGNFVKADEILSKAAAVTSNDAQGQFFLGLVRLQQGREADALALFTRARTLDPSYAEASYYAGEVLTRLDRNKEAIEHFLHAVSLRDNYFEAWYGLGTAYFELRNYAEAIRAFEKAKELRNNNAEVVANLGDAYRQSEDPALQDRKYELAETNYNLAVLFIERRPDFATSAEARQLAAEINGRKAFAIAKQCEINMARAIPCKWNTAAQALEKASQLSDSAVDHANLGWAYYNAAKSDIVAGRTAEGRTKLEKARDSLRKAIDSDSKYREGALLNLGMAYTDLGDHRGAIDALKQAVDRNPNWVFAWNELGIAYFNNGNFKDAIAAFKRAVDKDDKFAAAYYNLGRAQFKDGNLNEVKKAYSKLRSLGRNDLAGKLNEFSGNLAAR